MAKTDQEIQRDFRERMKVKGYRWIGMWVPDRDREEIKDMGKFKSMQYEREMMNK